MPIVDALRTTVGALATRAAAAALPVSALTALRRPHYLRAVRSFSEADEPEVAVLRALLRPGDLAVDLGAHAGWYTKVLAEAVGPTGHVMGVEPTPPTFALLRYCVARLGLTNVTLAPCAVAAARGTATLRVPRRADGRDNFYQASLRHHATPTARVRTYHVPTEPLDTLLAAVLDRVALIKVDVEGAEFDVLLGAAEVLRRSRPAWLIEVAGSLADPESPARRVLGHLLAQGYAAYWFDGRRLQSWEVGPQAVNYLFLTPEHERRLAAPGLLDVR